MFQQVFNNVVMKIIPQETKGYAMSQDPNWATSHEEELQRSYWFMLANRHCEISGFERLLE